MPPKRFDVDWTTITSVYGKPLSTATINIYRAAMNKVAQKDGYLTKEQIMKDQTAFVKVLEKREKDPVKRRHVLSALNRILDGVPYEQRTTLYEAYKRTQED